MQLRMASLNPVPPETRAYQNCTAPRHPPLPSLRRTAFASEAGPPDERNVTNRLESLGQEDYARGRIDDALAGGPGGGVTKVQGEARLRVDIAAPRGTVVTASAEGLFREVTLQRSNQMELSPDYEA
jgi:hypothetical protein